MDRLEAQKLLPEFSADCLDVQAKAAVQRWVEECPDCQTEWQSLQAVMMAASTASQPLLTPEQSRQMWSACEEKIYNKTEDSRLKQQNPSIWSWMQAQPRWGWAMVGGAVVVLGAAWFSNPDANVAGQSPVVASANVDDIGQLQTFGRQPSYAATMVDHHSQMALDPFADHVGSSLVSYSASAPQK